MERKANLFSPLFVIGSIRIQSIEAASCLNMGNNWPTAFESYKKQNQLGEVSGDGNHIQGGQSVLNDTDLFDMLNLSDQNIPDWVREVAADFITIAKK